MGYFAHLIWIIDSSDKFGKNIILDQPEKKFIYTYIILRYQLYHKFVGELYQGKQRNIAM